MSEQDNGLQLAVNNLATEMRRANYLNAIGIGGGNTKRPTLYQNLATRARSPSTTSTTCTAATPLASLWCIACWMVAGKTIRSLLTVMKLRRRRIQTHGKESHQVHEEAVAEGEGCRSPQYGRALLSASAAGQRQSELGSGSRHCFSKTTRRVSAGKTYPCVGAAVNRR